MGIIGWIVLGLIAGAIARAILPGRQGGGWLGALLTGIVGALLGGWIASLLFDFRMASLLTQATLWAVLGVALAELTSRLVDRSGGAAPRATAPAGSRA